MSDINEQVKAAEARVEELVKANADREEIGAAQCVVDSLQRQNAPAEKKPKRK